jgi:hypothetical protein
MIAAIVEAAFFMSFLRSTEFVAVEQANAPLAVDPDAGRQGFG